jgi:hypothetical protein
LYWKTRYESKEKELEVLRQIAASTILKHGNSSKAAPPAEDAPYSAGSKNRTYEFVIFKNAPLFLTYNALIDCIRFAFRRADGRVCEIQIVIFTADIPPIFRSISIFLNTSTVASILRYG